ncbi:MAG: hypothetical protein ACRCY3_11670 [Sphingorhabdus sp.]
MPRSHESAVQRIQVGVLGLLAVLLFVYIANLIVDRVVPSQAATPDPSRPVQAQTDAPKDEPLAELGVTPVVEDAQKTAPTPEPNAQPQP